MNNTATLNPVLTGLAQQFMLDQTGYVATKIAPVFNTGVPSGQYYVWDIENYLNLPTDINRSPGTAYKTLVSSLSDDAFVCKDLGIQSPVDDTERALYAASFSADQAASNRSTLAVMNQHEVAVQAMLGDAAIPTAAATANFGTATIVQLKADFRTATESIRLNCGIKPNVTIMSETVLNALLDNPALIAQIQYTVDGGVPDAEWVARVFSIPPIQVASSITNSADEGVSPINPADLWGDTVYLAVVNPAQDIQALNFARTFAWTGNGMAGNLSISTYRKDEVFSDFFVSHAHRGQKLTAPKAGYSITGALA